MSFQLTDKQREATTLISGEATHYLLFGGSRSGKTLVLLRAMAARRLMAPGSSGAVLRFRFNHLVPSIIEDTWPKMLDLCWPGLRGRMKQNRSDWFDEFPNGSRVWWGGLDDKERTEKVLGQEHNDILLNEVSQITFEARNKVVTRLAKQTKTIAEAGGENLRLRMFYDCNPPRKSHWSYRMFFRHQDPVSGAALRDPKRYAALQMNPADNLDNLSPEYIRELENLPKHMRARFLLGEYGEDNPNALFPDVVFERWRTEGELPTMQRVVVAVDPSGADEDHPEADAIGIVVVGLGRDGNAYVLEDLTVAGVSPATWGKIAVTAYQRHAADVIIGERNFGGAMVQHTIRTGASELGSHVAYRDVTASRGKVLRATPISALYEQGKVRHASLFTELEEELSGFATTGYTGDRSPNRADALVFALTELFPGVTRIVQAHQDGTRHGGGYEFEDRGGGDVELWKVA